MAQRQTILYALIRSSMAHDLRTFYYKLAKNKMGTVKSLSDMTLWNSCLYVETQCAEYKICESEAFKTETDSWFCFSKEEI